MAVGIFKTDLLVQCHCGILTAQLIRLPQPRGSKLSPAMLTLLASIIFALTIDYIEAQSAEMIERILTEINDTVQLRVGGKLTKFRGHKGIIENHESFIPEIFLPYGILVVETSPIRVS